MYDPQKHNKQSIRMKTWDYSTPMRYFLTVGPDTVRKYGIHNKKTNASIFDMMDWFKTMTTNEYIRGVKSGIWPRFEKRFWQKRYWDVIIFDEKAYLNIKNYIEDNPINWKKE